MLEKQTNDDVIEMNLRLSLEIFYALKNNNKLIIEKNIEEVIEKYKSRNLLFLLASYRHYFDKNKGEMSALFEGIGLGIQLCVLSEKDRSNVVEYLNCENNLR